MKHHRTLLLVVALALAAAACSSPGSTAPGLTTAPQASSSGTAAATIDEQFIDMMVPHHESAVAMAKLAKERSERPEIKELADEIIAAQEKEIAQLKAWRKEWFGSDETPPMSAMPLLPGMGMGGHDLGEQTMDMTADLKELEAAEDFDKAFLDAMIAHHEMAIEAAKIAEKEAQRPEIKELAGQIVAAQEREIAQMKTWLEAWY